VAPAVVRPVRRADTTAVVDILAAGSTAPQYEDASRLDDYWSAVEHTRATLGEVFVATSDDVVVGVVQVLIFRHVQHAGGWCCELESVHVRHDFRSRGIGAALLRRAEEFARERGCYRVQLTSNNVRLDAHRFYEREGYVPSHQGFKKHLA